MTRIVVSLAPNGAEAFKDLASRTGLGPFGTVGSAARPENFRYHQERLTKWAATLKMAGLPRRKL